MPEASVQAGIDPLWQLGKGESDSAKNAAAAKRIATPLTLLSCPSRREPLAWKCLGSFSVYNSDPIQCFARGVPVGGDLMYASASKKKGGELS